MVIRILVYTVIIMMFWVFGYALCYVLEHSKQPKNVGQLLMIEDEEGPMFMLEINAGRLQHVQPGQDIILTVTRQ